LHIRSYSAQQTIWNTNEQQCKFGR